MPFTVITLKKVPPSLRGDLTKWMQEIAVGVYVGNFNARIRENLWKRVCDAVGEGEASLSFMYHNEIGYKFQTINTERAVIDCDGIPLVLLPAGENSDKGVKKASGYSNAYKLHKARQAAYRSEVKKKPDINLSRNREIDINAYTVIDIETTGLDEKRDQILEIGAEKHINGQIYYFNQLIKIDGDVSENIKKLTGITDKIVNDKGKELDEVLDEFIKFVSDIDLVGYNVAFDVKFINEALKKKSMPELHNKVYDLMKIVKKKSIFQTDYKLQTSLEYYGIKKKVPHRALKDAILINELFEKVNKK